jgi:deoxyribonuclease V
MKITPLHEWNLSPSQAIELQKQLAFEVVAEDKFNEPVVVVLKFPELELVESAEAKMPIQFPYIPGLLSFRETPVAIRALEKLKNTPDLIICDGQGLAHPRAFGIACHIGLIADVPTIGAAKSVLVGRFENLGERRGSIAPMIYKKQEVGAAVRTRDKVQPVYVSVGHRIGLETAVKYVLACAPKYRLPETTRLADKMASFRKI